MTNAQHQSKSVEWYTPKHVIDLVHQVMPVINLDPASSLMANMTVKANRIMTERDNGLERDWTSFANIPQTIFLNPPGSKLRNKSVAALFWKKLMEERDYGMVADAIVIAFNLEQLRITKKYHAFGMTNFPICLPDERMRFISPTGQQSSPTHSNAIIYVPGTTDNTKLFIKTFESLGEIMIPAKPA